MLQFNPFDQLKRPLSRLPFVFLKGVVLIIATVLVVMGVSALVKHLLNPALIAKVRLEREGYQVDATGPFQAIEREDSLALVRLKTAGVSLLSQNAEGRTPYEVALRSDRLDMLEALAGLEASPRLSSEVLENCLVEALGRGAWQTSEFLLGRKVSPNLLVEADLPLLVWAMTTNREGAVDLLIRHQVDIHAASKLGTPLVLAYSQGNLALFDRLLTLGAAANQLDLTGRMLGVATIQEGKPDFTNRLLESKVDVNAKGKDQVSMLEAAFRLRQETLFVKLVQAGGKLGALDDQGRTFLERATVEKDHRWMELLLAQGVDANQRAVGSKDPLWWCSYGQGDPLAAEILLGAGADINAPDAAGITPIDLMLQKDNFRVARYLFSRGAKTSDKMWDSLRQKNYDMMRILLAHGAGDPSVADRGQTPLAFAIRQGDVTGAALLVEYGARYEKRDRPDGHSLLEWAISSQQLPLIELLVKQGADVNEPASRPANPEFLARFKENGNLQYHLRGDSNVTPLMMVAGSHQMDAARLLLDHGAKRHQWTKRHRTDPVTFAIRSENIPMAQLMLGREPELNGNHLRKVVVSRSDQRARFYKNGELVYSTRCSTGKSGYRTPGGTYVITDKTRLRYSTLYGSAMPFFHRLSGSAIGMHEGYVPGYPASHGCIRLPYQYAKIFFEQTQLGDIVVVE